MQGSTPMPVTLPIASAPRYRIEVRLTTTYRPSQNSAIVVATALP